ncbi:hypothetical protein CYLTODRAFT_491945 [Cylindrobasidium torrendii FP15055 ss-10]|uniref:RGS domain-containing protein n=1 Tax=Cylindrobasidium torrendii FP15055 ss-10 TaxID=1314674 RepID=A0A0D7B5S1_9AGAR|nr:hypothetical protein CYLTODRAFT_491945 [Cylindrobasidium torrendii FP15055 ss-10]
MSHDHDGRGTRTVAQRDYLVKLFPLAEKLNAKRLASVSLEQVLAGKTCYPISLPDFELYLAYNEMCIGKLQFVVWYRDYRHRLDTRIARMSQISFASDSTLVTAPTAIDITSPKTFAPSLEILPVTRKPDSDFHNPALYEECMQVVTTFLSPNSSKTLRIDSALREQITQKLEASCHYDLFEPIYKETYAALESEILPRFLAHALSNINLPKQLLWYALAVICFVDSIVTAVFAIYFIPPPRVNRAWRLIAVVPFYLSAVFAMAAFCGFCSQVFHRDSRQIHAWELRQMDEESNLYAGSMRATGPTPIAVVCNSTDGTYTGKCVPITSRSKHNAHGSTDTTRSVRPAIYGPERVIEDATVLKAHRGLMNDLLGFALLCSLVFSTVVFLIPGRST